MNKIKTETVQSTAARLAEWAHEVAFSSRRGVGGCEELPGFVVLYDNNPYQEDPDRRARELQELEARLEAHHIVAVARSSYPPSGPEAGYTTAIVFDAMSAANAEVIVHDTWNAVLAEGGRQLLH